MSAGGTDKYTVEVASRFKIAEKKYYMRMHKNQNSGTVGYAVLLVVVVFYRDSQKCCVL